jgi:hypothetical protein
LSQHPPLLLSPPPLLTKGLTDGLCVAEVFPLSLMSGFFPQPLDKCAQTAFGFSQTNPPQGNGQTSRDPQMGLEKYKAQAL